MIRRRQQRNAYGLGALELAFGGMFFAVILALVSEVGVVMLGYATVDRAARDAARAAAQQDNAADAASAAQAALLAHQTDGYWVSNPRLTGTQAPAFVYNDFGGDPLAGNPTVTVTTQSNIRLPVPVDFMGAKMQTHGSRGSGTLDIIRTYTFPIVRFKLNSNFD